MSPLSELLTKIRIALATHEKVTIENAKPTPKRLWRVIKKELPVCDVTFDERNVYVTWKKLPDDPLMKKSPEEEFAERLYESGRKRAEQKSFLKKAVK